MANAIQHPQIEKLAVWPYQTTNANRGTVPLPTVIWLGFTDNPDDIESFCLVRLVGNTIIRTRGQMIPGTDYTKSSDFGPGLSDVKQFSNFQEAYDAVSKMIFFERGPHESLRFYDAVENVSFDNRSE